MTRAELLEQWHQHLAAGRRRSPHTVRAYVATAARLLDQVEVEDWPALARLDGHALRTQLAARRADGIGNVSAARELSALKAFLGFAREQAGIDPAPPRLRGPRIKKGLPRPVTPDDAANLAQLQSLCGASCNETRQLAMAIETHPRQAVLTAEAVVPDPVVTQN